MWGRHKVRQNKPTEELYRTVSEDANVRNRDKGQIVGTGEFAQKITGTIAANSRKKSLPVLRKPGARATGCGIQDHRQNMAVAFHICGTQTLPR